MFVVFTLTPPAMISALGLSAADHEEKVKMIKKQLEEAKRETARVKMRTRIGDAAKKSLIHKDWKQGMRKVAALEAALERMMVKKAAEGGDSSDSDGGVDDDTLDDDANGVATLGTGKGPAEEAARSASPMTIQQQCTNDGG